MLRSPVELHLCSALLWSCAEDVSVQAPEDMTPDHDPLYLARALEDVVDLDVPKPLLDEVLPGVALGSHDLDGAPAGPKSRPGARRLPHRGLLRVGGRLVARR